MSKVKETTNQQPQAELEQLKDNLSQLKQSFDQSFSKAPNLLAEQTTPLLLFKLAHEIYAIELAHIQQVLVDFELTVLPFTPGFIEGVINLNGKYSRYRTSMVCLI